MIPSEFHYDQNLPKRSVQRARKLIRLVMGFDPVLPAATVKTWAESYYRADPVAERFVNEVYLTRGQRAGRAMVDQALASGVSSVAHAPQSLLDLFAEMETKPVWLDETMVELGARVFRRYGTHLFSFAGAITLQGYREASVAKPLAFTGAYAGESAQRRFLETAAFWNDVSAPHALRANGAGRSVALRVRLMHVFVRAQLLKHPAWNLEAWGVPISQGDALLTLMGGSVAPAYGLRALGYRTSKDETMALLHFWRYVGHLMGVQPEWYPQTIAEAVGLLFTSFVKSCNRAGDDGRVLAESYLASYAPKASQHGLERLRQQVEHGIQRGYVGLFLHRKTREQFGLPSPGIWGLHPFAQLPLIFARETVRRRSSRFDAWLDDRVQRQSREWVVRRLGPRKAEYRAVEHAQ